MKMKKWNVLVFPAGTEIGHEIYESLKNCKEVNLIGAGIKEQNPGRLMFSKYEIAPSIYEKGCLNVLKKIVRKHKIDRIYPAHDEVLDRIAGRAKELGAKIITSSKSTCNICRSKIKTYKVFKGILPVPRVIKKVTEDLRFPLFAKPDRGQGSRGAFLVKDIKTASEILSRNNMVLMENLPGKEFTVDCFSDSREGLIFCKGRARQKVANGISTQTKYVEDPRFLKIAKKIQKKLRLRGAWFFQLKERKSKMLVLLEIAPRIAGSSGISRFCGVNLPLLSLFESSGIKIKIKYKNLGLTLLRSLNHQFILPKKIQEAYIDFDDCLVVKEKINPECIRLIFEMKNRGIKTSLISKHSGNLNKKLERLGLSKVFDRVYHLSKIQKKSAYLSNKPSLFIDDSFRELTQVADLKNVTALHVSSINGLSLK